MQYTIFDFNRQALTAVSSVLATGRDVSSSRSGLFGGIPGRRLRRALLDSAYRLVKEYPKQSWAYPPLRVGEVDCPIEMSILDRKPFAHLLKFRRAGLPDNAPKVLFICALSGHHATLSKDTFLEFFPDHEVYVTDWQNARDVPLEQGRFGLEDYVDYVVDFLRQIGPDTHVVGLCQAAVPGLIAASLMAEQKDPARPRSLTLMGGPIDISVNPNQMYRRSRNLKLGLVNALMIHKVPARYAGAGRRVYSGVQQLAGFISLNPPLHFRKHVDYFHDVRCGRSEQALKHREFYDEYFAVLDTTAEFYLETLERIFIRQKLADGTLQHRGERVNPSAIRDIPILTVEGKEDNMVSVGQTQAAHTICDKLPSKHKEVLVQDGVGHYGVFSGEIYRNQIAPRVQEFQRKYSTARK